MQIKGLYQKRGWFYYQAPTRDGVRPPAVALKTQDAGEAVDKAFDLHTKGALHVQSKDRMDDFLEPYLKAQVASKVHTLKTSDTTRKTLTKLSKEWGNPKVSAIDRKRIDSWRADLNERNGMAGEKMSEASIHSYLRRLSGFLSWLVEQKHLREHPMKGIRLGRVKKTKRQRFCTREERESLLKDPPNEDIDFILHFGFFAGLRFGEMLAMQDTWLVKKKGGWVLTVQETPFWKPKDKECRTIEVHPRLAAFIDRYGLRKPFMLARDKSLWKDPPDYRYNPKKAFKKYVTDKGMPWVGYHTLRHSFATHLAMNGARMIEIAHALGDSLRVTEESYVGFTPVSKSKISSI